MDYDYKIVWSDKALADLENILEYLNITWTQTEISSFQKKLFKRIDLIGKNPKLFRASKLKPEFRRSVLSKQTSIFYLVNSDSQVVSIIRLFDNRMDEKKF